MVAGLSANPRVLVVYKKSAYQLYAVEHRDRHLPRLLRRRDPMALDMLKAHEIHTRALEIAHAILRRLGVAHAFVYRADVKTADRFSLVLSVGGDGTFLQAAHVADGTPLLGVNSDPSRSEAVFCAATPETLEPMLRAALAGRLAALPLARLEARLNGRALRPLIVNDVLAAHPDPATMSRYRLRIGRVEDDQKSSGLWVSTAPGSSSAILAAGGVRLPWSTARFQYRPRELYCGRLTRCRLTGGVLSARARVEVTWLTREGAVFIDGSHLRYPMRFGDQLAIAHAAAAPLRVLGLRNATRAGRKSSR